MCIIIRNCVFFDGLENIFITLTNKFPIFSKLIAIVITAEYNIR